MRVQGNASPSPLHIEPYLPKPGYVEVRLRENISEVSSYDEVSETTFTMFEYDEYTFLLKDKEGLKEEIEANIDDWLATGRTLEVNQHASLYVSARADAVDEYTEQLIAEGLL